MLLLLSLLDEYDRRLFFFLPSRDECFLRCLCLEREDEDERDDSERSLLRLASRLLPRSGDEERLCPSSSSLEEVLESMLFISWERIFVRPTLFLWEKDLSSSVCVVPVGKRER